MKFIISVFIAVIVITNPVFPIEYHQGCEILENDAQVIVKAPGSRLSAESSPKLLMKWYNRSYEPYVKVYCFKVIPGHTYTFYMFHPSKGIIMNAYLRGDNPLTDYTKDYGQNIGYLRSFITWAQQPSKSKCAYKVKRYNFKISEKSEDQWLYLVATFAKPEAHFKVLLKTDPPDSDHEVETSRANPFCSEQNYSSWGMVHKKDFLLTKIPEKK